jgi:type IV pilus assembly protein PilA
MKVRSRSKAGFTLVELMIVVGIIGVLAAIAIPNFMSYQARSRRSEAYVNLAGIARIQNTFYSERGEYFDAGSFPSPDPYGGWSARKMAWDADSENAFAELGWRPEGQVYYSYDANAGSTGCTCAACFTVSAIGDVDDDGIPSAVMYVHPETTADGVFVQCPSGIGGFFAPVDPVSDQPLYNTVAVNRAVDEY